MDIWHGMQVTKNSVCQWNTILNLVLSSLSFTKNFIEHALYTLQKKTTKDVLIVGCSTDDFLCIYSITYFFNYFLTGIKKYFPVKSKEGPELSYLNLRILQSPYVIRID